MPTTVLAGGGTSFMFWGMDGLVHGLTNRLLLISGQYRIRIVAAAGGLIANYHNDELGSRATWDLRGTLPKALEPASCSFEPHENGVLQLIWRNAAEAPEWELEPVHAGLVLCGSCLCPTVGEDYRETNCGEPGCAAPARELSWDCLQQMLSSEACPNLSAAVKKWRLVLNIGGHGP